MRALRHCAVVLALLVPVAAHGRPGAPGQDGLQEVVELTRSGAFPRALALAESQATPLGRAQAKLYVLHHAGDLAGALRVGLEGLSAEPRDLWLLERVSYIALSLRAADLAREHVDRLARALASPEVPAESQAYWRNLAADYATEVRALEASANERTSAARRARWTVFAGLGSCLAAVCCLLAKRSPVDERGRG